MQQIPVSSVKSLNSSRIEYVWVKPATHKQADASCEGAVQVPYIIGSAPQEYDDCTSPAKAKARTFFESIRTWFE